MLPSRWIAEAGFQGIGRQETGLFFKDWASASSLMMAT
jgi:hypothetical protein